MNNGILSYNFWQNFPRFQVCSRKERIVSFFHFKLLTAKRCDRILQKLYLRDLILGSLGAFITHFNTTIFWKIYLKHFFFLFYIYHCAKWKKKLAARFWEKLPSDVQLDVWTDIQTKKHKQELPYRGSKTKTCSAEIHTLKHQSKTCLKMAII